MSHKHEPDDKGRALVELHSAIGTPQDNIARLLKIAPKTLREHYREELDLGATKANGVIGGRLFREARDGPIAAAFFWGKTRMGMNETSNVNMQGALEIKFIFDD